ncbi:hypothetical protein KSW81_004988 [Nannochloris sp. 'desiccata']|nr:hypothetical protein KSW81_004988 [Chlorella desiccata (nom. nud.)]
MRNDRCHSTQMGKMGHPALVFEPASSPEAGLAEAPAMALAVETAAISPESWPTGNKFSIIIPSYNRTEILEGLLTHFNKSSCPSLKEIYVNWSNASAAIPTFLVDGRFSRYPVKIILPRVFSLEQRYVPPEDLNTEAVFQLDDDLRLSCEDLEFGFKVFKQFPQQIAGFVARGHYLDAESNTWRYTAKFDGYSLILTGAAFLHRRWLENFFNPGIMPPGVLEFVKEHQNCEDIAMNFLVSHTTKRPSNFVDGKVNVVRVPGISDGADHYNLRDVCLNKFAELYGYMPLENARSYIKVLYARNSPLHTDQGLEIVEKKI